MQNIKEVLQKIDSLEKEIKELYNRLREVAYIKIGMEVTGDLKDGDIRLYTMEEAVINSKLKFIEQEIEVLREKDIVGLNGEVV